MTDICLYPYDCEWSIGYLWHWMTWIGHVVIFLLALLLAYTVAVFIHVAFRSARLALSIDADDRSRRKLVADLAVKVGNIRSIAFAAPYLGLAGTCCGLMGAFRGVGMEIHAVRAMMTSIIAAAVLTTAAGILVAIPATCFYNYLFTRIGLLESETGNISRKVSARGNFPLAKAFSVLPTLAVIAAPALAISLLGFMILLPTHSTMGLYVRLLKIGSLDAERPPLVNPIMVRLLDSAGRPNVYVGSRPTRQDELNNALQASLNGNRTVNVAADGNVFWADVANAIDVIVGLGGDVVLLTAAPSNSDSGHHWRSLKTLKPEQIRDRETH